MSCVFNACYNPTYTWVANKVLPYLTLLTLTAFGSTTRKTNNFARCQDINFNWRMRIGRLLAASPLPQHELQRFRRWLREIENLLNVDSPRRPAGSPWYQPGISIHLCHLKWGILNGLSLTCRLCRIRLTEESAWFLKNQSAWFHEIIISYSFVLKNQTDSDSCQAPDYNAQPTFPITVLSRKYTVWLITCVYVGVGGTHTPPPLNKPGGVVGVGAFA